MLISLYENEVGLSIITQRFCKNDTDSSRVIPWKTCLESSHHLSQCDSIRDRVTKYHESSHWLESWYHCLANMIHVTYQLRLVLNVFFCSPLCVRIYNTAEFCMRLFLFFLNSRWAVSVFVVNKWIDRFSRYECVFVMVKTSRRCC